MSDIFDEVEEDLRADRMRKLLQRYGGLMVAAAVLIVAGVGAFQWWRARQAQENARVAALYMDAATKADAKGDADRQAAMATLQTVIGEGSATYRTLARLRLAALDAEAGKGADALALWDAVAADGAADPLLRDVARLHWAAHEVDAGNAEAVEAHLRPLTAPDNALRPLAEETQALLDLRQGKTDAARETLKRLSQDVTAPDGVRGRANGLLAQIGSR